MMTWYTCEVHVHVESAKPFTQANFLESDDQDLSARNP